MFNTYIRQTHIFFFVQLLQINYGKRKGSAFLIIFDVHRIKSQKRLSCQLNG